MTESVRARKPAETVRSAARLIDLRAEAFRRLTAERLDAAYSLAAVILSDREEAEDAVHDAAVSAWSRWGDLRDTSRFEAWFERIVVNACRDRLRARARRRVRDIGRELTESEQPPLPDTTERSALRCVLERALAELGPDEQIVLVLRYHADLSVAAIAWKLGVPEGTVKSRLHRALGDMRAVLHEVDR